MSLKIAIYGSGSGETLSKGMDKAREVGRQIARRGCVVVTGGCNGIPQAAIEGATELGGKCVAFSPAVDLDSHVNTYKFPTHGIDEFVFIPKSYDRANVRHFAVIYRGLEFTEYVDAAIIVGGRTGTMNEFTLAYDSGKNIGVLEGSGGITNSAVKALLSDIDKDRGSKIVFESDPVKLVDKLIELSRV